MIDAVFHRRATRLVPLAWLLVALGTAALGARALVAERQTVDDVFIFLRYARELALHGRYAFGPVAPTGRVEGTSSVAWTVALALVGRAGWRGLGAAKAMSLAVGLLVPVTCALALRRAVPHRPWLAALPAVALALDADLATWAASGMDTALFALAAAACVLLAAAGRETACAVALGALAWVRPEGPIFAVLGVLALSRDRRTALRLALLAAAPLAVLTLWRLVAFHDVVPNTVWAKLHPTDGKDYTGLGYTLSAVQRRPLLLVVLPAMAVVRPGRSSPALRLAVALLVASFVFAFAAGGDWMPDRRLLVVALPLAAVAAALGLARRAVPGLPAIAGVALLVEASLSCDHAVDQDWRDRERVDERVAHWQLAARPFVTPYALDWMPTYLLGQIAPYVAPGDVVAHVDVGELPYVMNDVVFLDGFGLVDRAAGRLAFAPQDVSLRAAASEAFFTAAPAVAIFVMDENAGRPFAPAQVAALEDPRFGAGWRELARVPTWGGHPCVTYVRRDLAAADEGVTRARIRTWLDAEPDVVAAP